jgi:hypothetical protein
MIRNLMALPCMLALVLACGQGRTDDQDTGATGGAGAESGALPADTSYTGGGIEDTTAAPSVDAGDTAAPAGDTASGSDTVSGSDTGSADPANQDPSKDDTVGATGEGAPSDTTY